MSLSKASSATLGGQGRHAGSISLRKKKSHSRLGLHNKGSNSVTNQFTDLPVHWATNTFIPVSHMQFMQCNRDGHNRETCNQLKSAFSMALNEIQTWCCCVFDCIYSNHIQYWLAIHTLIYIHAVWRNIMCVYIYIRIPYLWPSYKSWFARASNSHLACE